jgi:RNA polymerase sigma-70 factor, ECF subfamily
MIIDREIADGRTMIRLQSGDASAFDELFARHYPYVLRTIAVIVRDDARAEDLTQTVFLNLWIAPESFREGSLVAWLSRVGRNRAFDELRARRFNAPLPDVVDDGPTPDDRVAAGIDAERVRAALGTIAAEQRSPIELSYFAGLTHAQIADRTAVPLGTVKSRLRAGLRALRDRLEGDVS